MGISESSYPKATDNQSTLPQGPVIYGWDGANAQAVLVDSSGRFKVIVDNTLTISGKQAATATQTRHTVSTTAVKLLDVNANRLGFLVTNNVAGGVFLGYASTVTASGANVGHILQRAGSWSMDSATVYSGEIWAICDTVVATQNVCVTEFTA